MDDYFLIYRAPVVKHITVLFIASSAIMVLMTALFLPGTKNIDLIISAVISIRNYLFFIYSVLIAGYLFQLIFTYQELYFFNDVMTFRNIYGRKFSGSISQLVKISRSKAAYNFHFEMPGEKIYALDSFLGPEKFESVLLKITGQRIDCSKKIIFEYGRIQKEL